MKHSQAQGGILDRFFGPRRARIFISYRRTGDGSGYGGRIAEKLIQHFGADQCFRDVESIESGVDFVVTINRAVEASDVMILVIGPDWLTQVDDDGTRRLDNPRDFVRIELAGALQRDIRVIPVLVGNATMPGEEDLPDVLKGLSRRQAHELSDSRWDYDSGRLVEVVESIGIRPRKQGTGLLSRSPRMLAWVGGIAVVTILVVAAVIQVIGSYMEAAMSGYEDTALSSPAGIDNPALQAIRKRADAGSGYPPGNGQPQAYREAQPRQQERSASAPVAAAAARGFSPGAWLVRWQAGGVLHEGALHLNGDTGTLQVSFANPGFGTLTIRQQVSVEFRPTETVISGFDVRVAGSGAVVPPTVYSPDHAHLSFSPQGLPVARFCDFNHSCYPANIRAAP